MALKLHEVEQPRIPENGWMHETAMDIIAGRDEELAGLLKAL